MELVEQGAHQAVEGVLAGAAAQRVAEGRAVAGADAAAALAGVHDLEAEGRENALHPHEHGGVQGQGVQAGVDGAVEVELVAVLPQVQHIAVAVGVERGEHGGVAAGGQGAAEVLVDGVDGVDDGHREGAGLAEGAAQGVEVGVGIGTELRTDEVERGTGVGHVLGELQGGVGVAAGHVGVVAGGDVVPVGGEGIQARVGGVDGGGGQADGECAGQVGTVHGLPPKGRGGKKEKRCSKQIGVLYIPMALAVNG